MRGEEIKRFMLIIFPHVEWFSNTSIFIPMFTLKVQDIFSTFWSLLPRCDMQSVSKLHKDMLTNRDLIIKETMWHFSFFQKSKIVEPWEFFILFSLFSVSKWQQSQMNCCSSILLYCFVSRYLNIFQLLCITPQVQKSQKALKLVPELSQNLVQCWSAQLPWQPDSQSYCRKKDKLHAWLRAQQTPAGPGRICWCVDCSQLWRYEQTLSLTVLCQG